jgi:hypothetical protein
MIAAAASAQSAEQIAVRRSTQSRADTSGEGETA